MMSDYILEMKNITKEFPGVKALDNVSFKVKKGEIHALVGENGAGKSTLMKVLSGVYPHHTYTGEVIVKGSVQHFERIKDSEKIGIAIIYQELTLVKQFNIAENIFLGNEKAKTGIINWNKTITDAKKILKEVKLEDSVETKVLELGIGKQQLVEIAKALSKNVDILILDEPTAALNEEDSENLIMILKELKEKGVTCIYISHKLHEVIEIADTVTILRDGQTVATRNMNDKNERFTEQTMITNMVGRQLTNRFPVIDTRPGETVLEVKDWTIHSPEIPDKVVIDGINLKAKRGEILGIAGLMGAGRTEFVMSLIGAYGIKKAGEIKIESNKVVINNPKDAIKNGISYLSEDRKGKGLILSMDIKYNNTLAALEKISKGQVIDENKEINVVTGYVHALKTKTPSIEQKVGNLSGGNQQKVAIAKWLMTDPKILILDEPTRGIDVGAKYEIYMIMNDLAKKGVCVIMISSELPEILGMSDRILVMNKGKITGELNRDEATQEKVMYYATGGM
ncbi:MAG: Monosaccharide-transporting ATPase [Clostridia bacterium]|jgi:D-xylose transport system ATP-binding protein|nr:Monosaccharide-transporting ATPase [Clostridia bacterium]